MEMTTHTEHGVHNVMLSGKFSFTDNPEFRTILVKIADPGIKSVVLHMGRVDFVDSAALGMLLLAYDEAENHKKSLILRDVSGQVKRIFEMARFEQFFKFQ